MHPATLQHIKSQREQLRKQKFETGYPPHHSIDVDPVDLQQNSSTTVHKPHTMYKVILPTWYHASAQPGWQPHLPTGQWYPHHGAAPATTTSSPEATASPSATATSTAAPNTATVVTATEPSETSTPTAEAASAAAMEIDSVPAADGTPAATPLT